MLEPTNTIVTLTEVWAAKSLSKEAILVTDSVGVAGVPLGGGGGGVRGDLTLLHLPGFNTLSILKIEDFGSSTLVGESETEKALAPLTAASSSG